jgi:dihydrodipicolinate synthase/N-acetylneuraminate lyase
MPRNTPPNYEKKFADFIRLCRESKVAGVKVVVVAAPSVIGDNYDEIIESLSRLAEAGLGLQIADPEPPRRDVSRN